MECKCNHDCFNCPYPDCIENEVKDYSKELNAIDSALKDLGQKKEKVRNRAIKYAASHREENRIKSKKYYYANHEENKRKARERSIRYRESSKIRNIERRMNNPELERHRQREYRNKVRERMLHCDECEDCTAIINTKGTGDIRLCLKSRRLIERKVTVHPNWCSKKER